MLDNDGTKSTDGSSCSSRVSSTILSEQGPSVSNTPSNGSTLRCHLPPFNSAHVKVIPSLHVSLPSEFKYLQLQTLTKETITLAVHLKCRVRDAYLCSCAHLGINEDRLLGLAVRTPSEGIGADRPRHEYFFLEPEHKITKYAPKQGRFSHAWNTVVENRPFLVVYLRVRVYVDKVQLIRCPVALHHYYLQLRENLLDQWSGSNSVSEERCWEMAALALQADYAAGEHFNDQNFRAEQYFPLWVINIRGLDFVRRNMPAIRNDLRPCSRIDATLEYCHEASRSPFALNCHLYGLRRYKMDTVDNAIIGITPRGIEMSDVGNDGERIPLRSLRWGQMEKLSFDKRKLSITGVDGACISLYAQSEQKARYLLEFCRALHRAIIDINKHYLLNPYAYPNDITSAFSCGDERSVDGAICSRRSLLSHTSSNSTSGVVSDKPSSEPDKEGESSEVSRVTSECSYEESSIRTHSLSDVVAEMERTSFSRNASDDSSTEIENKPLSNAVLPSSSQLSTARSVELSQSVSSAQPIERLSTSTTTTTLVSGSEKGTASSKLSNSHPATAPPSMKTSACSSVVDATDRIESLDEKRSSTGSDSSSPPELPHTLPPPLLPTLTVLQYAPKLQCTDCVCAATQNLVGSSHSIAANATTSCCCSSALPNDIEIRQPPLYREAVSISKRAKFPDDYPPVLHRPNANPNVKPRWTTVTGVGFAYPAPADCSGSTSRFTNNTQDISTSTSYTPLQYSAAHLARSEPKLDRQVWSRPVSPLLSVSPSSVAPVIVASSRPTPSNTPPYVGGTQGVGLFQKQSRSGIRAAAQVQHNARGINRVQSMPAHNPHHFLQNSGDSSSAAAALHHAHSVAARPVTIETKQPPSYEHALLQARARCAAAQRSGATTANNNSLGAAMNERDLLHECHTYNAPSTDNDEDLSLNSRIGQYPMMRALWQEQQQDLAAGVARSLSSSTQQSQPPSLTTSSCSNAFDRLSASGGINTMGCNGTDQCSSSMSSICTTSLNRADSSLLDSLLTPHLRRPSSCQDLSSPLLLTPPHSAPMQPTSALLNSSLAMQSSLYGYGYMPTASLSSSFPSYMRTTAVPPPPPPPPIYRGEYYFDHPQIYRQHYIPLQTASLAQNSWTPSQSVLDLPPPPPYPPPRSSPSPREAPMVM